MTRWNLIQLMKDGSNQRDYIAEIPYPTADLSGCEDGQLPNPETWLKYLHSIALYVFVCKHVIFSTYCIQSL